jgi:hypothetical protein
MVLSEILQNRQRPLTPEVAFAMHKRASTVPDSSLFLERLQGHQAARKLPGLGSINAPAVSRQRWA